MARYTGPRQKKARSFKDAIFGPSKALERKPYPPGQNNRSKFGRKSEYAIQLMEKQKVKYTYGILEKQFYNLYIKAHAKKGVTGDNLMRFLEMRLDNTVFRMGFSQTRRQARQFVGHRHIMVNGQIVNIPSYTLKEGDILSIRPKSRMNIYINDAMKSSSIKKFKWLEIDKEKYTGKIVRYPDIDEIPEKINMRYIIEIYSK